jgi:uncharacterized protein (DUF2384 family)
MASLIQPQDLTHGIRFTHSANLRDRATRERLSQSAMDGFFRIAEHWGLKQEDKAGLLGNVQLSTLHRLRTAAGTRSFDELTRISCLVGIYKALHVVFPPGLADAWITRPNDHPMFRGGRPLDYLLETGIPGLQQVRGLLDSYRGGF